MTSPGVLIAGRYELGRPLGRGSFAHTYEARDAQADRRVAVKVLDPREATDLKVMELFDREASVLRALRHHGIPEIFDVLRTTWKGTTATLIVMELVEGRSLAEVIDEKRPMDPDEVMHLFLEMLGILEYIHGRVPPILHRDIKPPNIIVRPDGSPALVDFGSARREFHRPNEAGSTVAGTYGYMPYEQYMGQATPSSDLFALGATFLHLLTGRPPRDFVTESGHIEVPDTLPGDERLAPIIRRMLEHSPNDRFPTARAVRQALLPAMSTSVARFAPPAAGVVLPTDRFVALTAAPRVIDHELDALVSRLSPGAIDLMSAGEDINDSNAFFDGLSLLFFSAITVFAFPLTFYGVARARRRKALHFVQHGISATARIDQILMEKGPFDVPQAKVSFAFYADGRSHRSADTVMPSVADHWRVGDDVQVLYDPKRAYGAIIISPS